MTSLDLIQEVFSKLSPPQIKQLLFRTRTYLQEFNPRASDQADLKDKRPELDPLPLVLSAEEMKELSGSVQQWGRLLTQVYQDLWDGQELLKEGIVEPRTLWEKALYDPGFHRLLPKAAKPLTLLRLDLVKLEGVGWRVSSLGTGIPRGLGYSLENRIVHSRVFGPRLPRNNVVRLAPFFQNLKDVWFNEALTHKDEPNIMVWTPGPNDPHYFEHVYLSRYFAYPLVESRDLTVRSGKLYLKMLGGLYPCDVLIRMCPDYALDPLTGNPPGMDGVAGLAQAVREGNVVVSNAPGSDLLEHPALLPAFEGASRVLLGEDLLLPPWKGDVSFSKEPFWEQETWKSHPLLLRVFALRNGESWDLMPGGLAQNLGPAKHPKLNDFSQVRKDIWILSKKSVPFVSLLPQKERPAEISRAADLPSRVADDLFWLGRYAERAWIDLRFLEKWIDQSPYGDDSSENLGKVFLVKALQELEIGPADPLVFESSAASGDFRAWRLFSTLAEIDRVSKKVRDRFSLETHRIIAQFGVFLDDSKSFAGRESLEQVSLLLAAFNGLTMENMTRGNGWRFLDMGKRLERAQILLEALTWFFNQKPSDEHLSLLLELFDSIITYRSRYRLSPQVGPVLDLLLLDETNPRSLAFQSVQLQQHVQTLPRASSLAYLSAEERIILDMLTRLRLADGGNLAQGAGNEGSKGLKGFLKGLSEGFDQLSATLHQTYLAKIESIHSLQARKKLEGP